ncbi:MAG: hypothetical protein MUF54_20825 [Polyangiaceae bacterium]|jgi:hypothetical protein|nr:hypothetical protein [Polyangiaceae bacterium]
MASTSIAPRCTPRLHTRRRCLAACIALPASVITGITSTTAHADQLVIDRPGQHIDYIFEAEPHGLLGILDAPGPGDASGGLGFGFRGTLELVDNGFIDTINNTIGIGFGLDWVQYQYSICYHGPDTFCTDEEQAYLWLPLVMQWNFWLSGDWSVFGEPGAALRLHGPNDDHLEPFVLYAGGRWHFAETATLTMRLGHPTFSIGVSFLL